MDHRNTNMELVTLSTTPQKALQLLGSCPSPDTFHNEADGPFTIFQSYFLFIVERLPDALVNGIWEELLQSTIQYSRNLNYFRDDLLRLGSKVSKWLNKALSSSDKCPNHYIRLELFRIVSLFKLQTGLCWERIRVTFMHTIGQIQPNYLCQDNMGSVLFSISDLHYIISVCQALKFWPGRISTSLVEELQNTNSKRAKFLLNCLNIIGLFAYMTSVSNNDSKTQELYMYHCLNILLEIYWFVLNSQDDLSIFDNYKPSLRETVRDITTAITRLTVGHKVIRELMNYRDSMVKQMCLTSQTNALPKLILDRQLHASGIREVQRHALLFRELGRVYNKTMSFADEDSDSGDKYVEYEEEYYALSDADN